MTDIASQTMRPTLGSAMGRGLLGRCPNCGKGRLLVSYLKPVANCSACGEAYGHVRSDDAAPWLTIIVVGHIVVPLVWSFGMDSAWPVWASIVFWQAIALGLTLAILPRAKTFLMAVIWWTGAPGSEREG